MWIYLFLTFMLFTGFAVATITFMLLLRVLPFPPRLDPKPDCAESVRPHDANRYMNGTHLGVQERSHDLCKFAESRFI